MTIGVFTENGRELSQEIYEQVETSMKAIEAFLEGIFLSKTTLSSSISKTTQSSKGYFLGKKLR